MSTNQRKRRGEEDDSGQAPKRSRLLSSSTSGSPEPEPADLKESGAHFFELAGEEFIGVTADSSESEDINLTGNDSGSVVQPEQNQQHPCVSGAADNSAVLLADDDDVEPRDSDGTWSSGSVSSSDWTDEFSEQWDQSQELPLLSIAVCDSVALLASDDDDELRDNDGLFGPLTSVLFEDCFLWQPEQNQQHPCVSRAAVNSVLLLASDDEEEGRNSNSTWSSGSVSSSDWMDEVSELLEECEQRSQLLWDSSVPSDDDDEDESTGNDVSVTDSTSEEEDSSEEETESSDDWPAAIIRCPICMDFYPQIMQSGRLILSTLCGHVFCSECLPVALQTAGFCPTCKTDLSPEQYHPIYI